MGRDARANDEQRKVMEGALRDEIARTGVVVLDRFGRRIMPGMDVELHSALPVILQVKEITHALDPRIPAGTGRMALEATVLMHVPHGAVQQQLTVVRVPQAPEASQDAEQNTGQDTPPTDPPPTPEEPEPPAGPREVIRFPEDAGADDEEGR